MLAEQPAVHTTRLVRLRHSKQGSHENECGSRRDRPPPRQLHAAESGKEKPCRSRGEEWKHAEVSQPKQQKTPVRFPRSDLGKSFRQWDPRIQFLQRFIHHPSRLPSENFRWRTLRRVF